jgi:UDP-glucuronate decarboxylase
MSALFLVPGAAGFIGSHLCERLIEQGADVLGLDDLSTGHPSHLRRLEAHPRFRFVRHDIVRPLPPQCQEARVIVNLACPASPAHYQRHPVQTMLTSAIGVWRLLELAERNGARLMHASTSEVYGDALVHPQVESYFGNVNPIGPRSCYDEGKRGAESLVFAYHRERRVDIRIARIFNTYGPRLRHGDGRVVTNFIVQALTGEPLTVFGDGLQTRSFCFVDDTVEGLLRLLEGDVEGPLNIGNPDEHTVLDLAQRVLRLTGSRSRIVHRPLPADDPHRRRPDISRAHRKLGWMPHVSIDDGLRETIRWFRRELQLAERPAMLNGHASRIGEAAPS